MNRIPDTGAFRVYMCFIKRNRYIISKWRDTIIVEVKGIEGANL